jgi:hypothetical protein
MVTYKPDDVMQDRFLKWTGRLVNDRLQGVALSRLKTLSPFRIVDCKVFVGFNTLFYYLPKFIKETYAYAFKTKIFSKVENSTINLKSLQVIYRRCIIGTELLDTYVCTVQD